MGIADPESPDNTRGLGFYVMWTAINAGLALGLWALWQAGEIAEAAKRRAAAPEGTDLTTYFGVPFGDWQSETPFAWRDDSDFHGDGSLLLTVRDADERPIPNLAYHLFVEEPRFAVIGVGRTNRFGRAIVHGLPLSRVFVVETERYAEGAAATLPVVLESTEPQLVRIRTTIGGVIDGIALDDEGTPLASVTVDLDDAGTGPVRATTGIDGRFRFDHVVDRPRRFVAIGDRWRAKSFDRVVVAATGELSRTHQALHIREGETRNIALILARPIRARGRIVDDDGEPVAGALVSINTARVFALLIGGADPTRASLTAPPGSPAFEQFPYEAATDGSGEFELPVSSDAAPRSDSTMTAVILTESGQIQRLELPPSSPGDTVDLGTLTLQPATLIELDVTADRDLPATLSVFAITGDRQRTGRVTRLVDGHYLVQVDAVADGIDRLGIVANGFAELRVATDGLESGEVIAVELESIARHVLRLRIEDHGDGGRELHVTACQVPPRRRWSSDPPLRCGLCGEQALTTTAGGNLVALSLPSPNPYWVYIEGDGDNFEFGPFRPDADTLYFCNLPASQDAGEAASSARDSASADRLREVGGIVARLSSELGDEAFHGHGQLDEIDGPRTYEHVLAGPWIQFDNVDVGHYELIISADRHYEERLDVTVTAEPEQELAPIELQPLPATELVLDDGAKPARRTWLAWIDIDGEITELGEVDAERHLLARAELPQSALLEVRQRIGIHTARQYHRVAVSDNQPVVVPIAGWVEVEIDLVGLPEEQLHSRLPVRLAPFADVPGGESNLVVTIDTEELVHPNRNSRRYRAWVQVGRYHVVLDNGMVQTRRSIEVNAPTAAPDIPRQSFEIVPIARY